MLTVIDKNGNVDVISFRNDRVSARIDLEKALDQSAADDYHAEVIAWFDKWSTPVFEIENGVHGLDTWHWFAKPRFELVPWGQSFVLWDNDTNGYYCEIGTIPYRADFDTAKRKLTSFLFD